ncbi:2-dehydro-3-deoxy-phosphogluconate aldolase [Staphylococcus succinus]|uniref:2-dehydro-3-deoxyphosphooctonate aldolase n=1 Tax=Staphylococcus succinus TaxID=61015 RepID=A0ABX5IRK8_9STAP|nr:KDGP aldolase [Staphylococcus succinus]PTI70286.1 2-dehydro-3-deoxyphosphooctonate aldolase [Staphylococcus succinus]RIN27388.1 oxo-acid lyase [Staphylococcus succinus]RIN40589.1 oxo-acid lyase [Staphylococcus succinus]RIN45713.1 oxo-acid lyase [Staphylococcus succinus]
MKISNRFYKDRVSLNVLAKGEKNIIDIYQAAEKNVVIGVLSKDYESVAEAVDGMRAYGVHVDDAISIGLGAGDNRQAKVVSDIARSYQGSHINQVFTSVGQTAANSGEDTWVNALVSPSGKAGYVNISTGPFSSACSEKAIIPVEAAIQLIKDMGGSSIKFFPMNGLETIEEYKYVAQACGAAGFGLEPTGGITKENFEEILQIALESNVPKIIPHVYSSIIDKDTGLTNIDDVAWLTHKIKSLVDHYE